MATSLQKPLILPKSMDTFFGVTKSGSSLRVEIFAGLSTFLALSYIFVVNPSILSSAGIPKNAVFFATIAGSVIATLAMGLWAKKPFAVAPGLEMNAYVAYVVVGVMQFSWQDAMGAVFWSGILTVLLNYTRIRVKIIDAIPDSLKSGLAASVGVFLVLVALKVSGIFIYQGVNLRAIGSLTSTGAILFYIGLVVVVILRYFKVTGAVLLSIIAASVVAHFLGYANNIVPISLSRSMLSATFALHLGVIFNRRIWATVIILFVLDFYGTIAKFIGLTRNTSMVQSDGTVPNLQEALTVDGGGTVLGASLGTSNLITFVESAVGIGEGGRTGITAVVCAVLMSMFLLLTPLVNLVPVEATTGALLFIGLTLLPKKAEWKKYLRVEMIAVSAMIIVTVWTFALDRAMFTGFAILLLGYLIFHRKRLDWYLAGSTAVLLVSMLLSR